MVLSSSFWGLEAEGRKVCWGRVCEANYVRDAIFVLRYLILSHTVCEHFPPTLAPPRPKYCKQGFPWIPVVICICVDMFFT